MLQWALEQVQKRFSVKSTGVEVLTPPHNDYPLIKNYFYTLPISSPLSPSTTSCCNIAYVDGGQADIISTPEQCISLIRTLLVIFNGNQKKLIKKFEFFCSVQTSPENEISYVMHCSPNELLSNSLNNLVFNSWDKSLMEGFNRVRITKIPELIRKLAEIKTLEFALKHLSAHDILVWDGSLEVEHAVFETPFQILLQQARSQSVSLIGLSKTCTLLTQQGRSVIDVLRNLAPEGKWYYSPYSASQKSDKFDTKAYLVFAKLHSLADHIFRVEITPPITPEIILQLSEQSKDPVFLGYPYGLILCDQLARVSNHEKELLSVKLRTTLHMGHSAAQFEKSFASTNAHSILDSIQY